MRVLLPEPETPVTAMKVPSGKVTETFFRLLPVAPRRVSFLPLPLRRGGGGAILRWPPRYWPVMGAGARAASGVGPAAAAGAAGGRAPGAAAGVHAPAP